MNKLHKLNDLDLYLENLGVGSHMREHSCKYSIYKCLEDYNGFNVHDSMKYNIQKKLAVLLNTALYLIMPKKENKII